MLLNGKILYHSTEMISPSLLRKIDIIPVVKRLPFNQREKAMEGPGVKGADRPLHFFTLGY